MRPLCSLSRMQGILGFDSIASQFLDVPLYNEPPTDTLPEGFLHLGLFTNSGPTLDAKSSVSPSLHEYFMMPLE